MKFPTWLLSLNLPALLAQINTDLAPLEQIGLAAIPGNPAPLVPMEHAILQSIIGSTLTHVQNLANGTTPLTVAVTAAPIPTVVATAAILVPSAITGQASLAIPPVGPITAGP